TPGRGWALPRGGSLWWLWDSHYAQQQLVCAACGCVLAEGLLTTTYAEEEHLREVAYSQSTGQKEQLSRCLQRGKSAPFASLHTPILSCCSGLLNMFLMLSKTVKAFRAGSKA
uniref:Uncharacterized protein n=1 Tax=Otus sunia TaxID=257818 RepID=A0A8C8A930_9STRI